MVPRTSRRSTVSSIFKTASTGHEGRGGGRRRGGREDSLTTGASAAAQEAATTAGGGASAGERHSSASVWPVVVAHLNRHLPTWRDKPPSRDHGVVAARADVGEGGGVREVSVQKVVPTLTSESAEIYPSMAGAKQLVTRDLSWFRPGLYVQQWCARGTILHCTVVLAEGGYKRGRREGRASRSQRFFY
jgi:hypothetical protein